MQIQKTYMAKKEEVEKKWYVINAENQVLGRLATKIATILMGKHNPYYTSSIDTGDFVVITNAEKIKVTGRKRYTQLYYRWSGYPGGLKAETMDALLKKTPEKLIATVVRRMLPKNRLGRRMLKKLKIYTGSDHPHAAQCPKEWKDPQLYTKD